MFKAKAGFTLLELLIVLGILVALAAAVFFWLDPVDKIGKAKDKKRLADVMAISSALNNYVAKHNGALPVLGAVTTDKKVLCSSVAQQVCAGLAQYCLKVDDQNFYDKYLGQLPIDPDKTSPTDTGYYLQKDANNNLIIGACDYAIAEVSVKAKIAVSCTAYGGGACWYTAADWLQNCNTVCAAQNKVCVSGVGYGPDILCILPDAFNDPYTCIECGLASGEPPGWADDNSCSYNTAPIDCTTAAGGIAVCPCK